MIVLELTDPDGEKVVFNWDNVIAIASQRNRFASTTASTVRVRDGSIYDVKETMAAIRKQMADVRSGL
jgi:hypothetical protein